jgi:hypothetical protein
MTATRVRPVSSLIVAFLLAAAALAACGSNSPHHSDAPTVPLDPGSGSGPSPTGAAGSAGSTGVIAAPKAFQALPLLTQAGLTTALGTPLKGFQDDGGTASTEGFISIAETEDRLTRFRVSLQSYPSAANATQAYNELTRSGGTALAGLGDKAMDLVATQVVVLKASQVLLVGVYPTPAGLDYIGENDKSPASLLTLLDKPARAVATAIAPHLVGTAVSGPYLQLPAGGLDPCALSIKAIATATKQDVSATNGPSEDRPSQQCNVRIATSPYLVQTYTSTQAAAAVPATTLAAVYAADAKVKTPGQRVQTASAHLKAYLDVDTDFTLEVLITGAPVGRAGVIEPAGYVRAAPETAHQALLRIRNARTAPVSREHCYELGREASLQLVVGMPEAEAKQFFDELVDWCSKFPSRNR